jgi:trimethylamine:corrinoid methyltransferase-like protein
MVDLSRFDVDRVWLDAKRLLREVGLHVESPRLLEAARGDLIVDGSRVKIPERVSDEMLASLRSRFACSPNAQGGPTVDIFNNGVHFRYLDPETDEEMPWTVSALAEHFRFILQLGVEGVFRGGLPGYPVDVSGPLQFLFCYYLNCLYNPNPGSQGLCADLRPAEYCIEIAELMGQTHGFCVEPISPMNLTGGSVDVALKLFRPGMWVVVDPMPVMGVTAPLDWHAAWAQSVAENVGACILLRACGIEDCGPSFRLFLPNFANGLAYFASPLHLTGLLTRRKVREYFGMTVDSGELMLASSHRPDQQAAAEKMAGCLAGALHGIKYLEGAGSLNIDVVFSARQLMVDLEIRDFVRSMAASIEPSSVDAVSEVREGIAAGSFLESDLTLAAYGQYGWKPNLFEIGTPSASPLWERAKKANVKERAEAYAYELRDERREELERVMERARAELG